MKTISFCAKFECEKESIIPHEQRLLHYRDQSVHVKPVSRLLTFRHIASQFEPKVKPLRFTKFCLCLSKASKRLIKGLKLPKRAIWISFWRKKNFWWQH